MQTYNNMKRKSDLRQSNKYIIGAHSPKARTQFPSQHLLEYFPKTHLIAVHRFKVSEAHISSS